MGATRHGLEGAVAGGAAIVLVLAASPILLGGFVLVSEYVARIMAGLGPPIGGIVAGYRRRGSWKGGIVTGALAGCLLMLCVLIALVGTTGEGEATGSVFDQLWEATFVLAYGSTIGSIGGVLGSEPLRDRFRPGLVGVIAGVGMMVLGPLLGPGPGGGGLGLVSGAIGAVIFNLCWPVGGFMAGYLRRGSWQDCALTGSVAGFLLALGIMIVLVPVSLSVPSVVVTDLFTTRGIEFVVSLLRVVAIFVASFGYATTLGAIGGALGSNTIRNRIRSILSN